jgi:hypothetical protein
MTRQRRHLLVIGATSLIGRRLYELLQAHPYVDDYEADFTSRKRLTCKVLCLDLTRPHKFLPEMPYDTAIVCSPIWLLSDEAITHLQTLGLKRLIVFSSTSRFTKTHSDEGEERKIAQKLIDAEAVVEAVCLREKIDYTILRPSMIYDEGRDQNISKIVRLIDKLGLFIVCDKAMGLRQPVHAHDLARAALQAVPVKASFNRAYNLSGGETLTYRAMVERIFAAKDMPARIFCLPSLLWRLGFSAMNLIRPKHRLKLNVQMALRMNKDMVFDHTDATRDFGYRPRGFDLSGFQPKPHLSDQTASSCPEGSVK